jgi:hypothetical protein
LKAALVKVLGAAHETLPQDLAACIRDVVAICNRVIHGEEIRSQEALAVAETGGELLEGWEQLTRGYAAAHPQAREAISKTTVEAYQRSCYRLTRVSPYVDNPQRLTYVLSHEEREAFPSAGMSSGSTIVSGVPKNPTHRWVEAVHAGCSSRTLQHFLQLCRKCNFPGVGECLSSSG